MEISGIDHIVLAVADVERTIAFYQRVLAISAVEQRPGQWALSFGANRISLQRAGAMPPIAQRTTAGSGNFCLLTTTPIDEVAARLRAQDVTILEGPVPRIGAAGSLLSVYFNDPDGNLVEVANVVAASTQA